MNPVKCLCIHCGGAIEFDEDAAGQEFDCPHCGKKTWVDLPGKMSYLPPGSRSPFRPQDLPRKVNPKLEPCGHCLAEISREAVFCPHCGQLPSLVRVAVYIIGVSILMSFIFIGLFMFLSAVEMVFK